MTNLQIQFELSEALWREVFTAHYARDHKLRIRYSYGVALLVIGSAGFGGLYPNPWIAGGLLLLGLYCLLSKPLLVNKSLSKLRRDPGFPGRIDFSLDQDGLRGTSQGQDFDTPWAEFRGYRKEKPGYLLYLRTGSFFFIPAAALSSSQEQELLVLLKLNRLGDLNQP